MLISSSLLIATLVACPAVPPAQDKSVWPKADPGPRMVVSFTFEWKDAARDREVPVRIYHPKDLADASRIIVFSHGTGGSRDTYKYLADFWTSHGYVCVHPQHHGSDVDIFKGGGNPLDAVKKAVANPKNALERPKDITFVLDELVKLNKDHAIFKGKLNVENVGLAGHSFGAHTTQVVGGQTMAGQSFKDKRVKAIIPMSGQAPKLGADKAFAGIKVPSMHMTGTLDDSPVGDVKAKDRRVPYDKISGADKYFINFEGGDHMIFSGRGTKKTDRGKQDAEFQRLIRLTSLAFWDAYLKDDSTAATWLAGKGVAEFLGTSAALERKVRR